MPLETKYIKGNDVIFSAIHHNNTHVNISTNESGLRFKCHCHFHGGVNFTNRWKITEDASSNLIFEYRKDNGEYIIAHIFHPPV